MKGLLFDLDGVIVDTAKYHFLAWKDLAEELGIEFTLEDNERLKGVSRVRSFQIILEIGNVTMPEDEQERYCTKKNDQYVQYIGALTKDDILPGVYEFLLDVKEKGYKIGLGSASKNAKFILERLELVDLFDVLVDGTKVSKAKPDPEVFTNGADGLDLSYEECIVFEDAVAGIEAAHNAGMKAVGVGSKALLPEADMNIDSFSGLTIEIIEDKLA